jgi:hypothetical protein
METPRGSNSFPGKEKNQRKKEDKDNGVASHH